MKFWILSLSALCLTFHVCASERFAEKSAVPPLPPLPVEETQPGKAWKEIPYTEDNPLPAFTEEEKSCGMMLFSRPITNPVYPQTRPAPWERTKILRTFAARGQIATLHFTLFPVRDLKGVCAAVENPFRTGAEFRQTAYRNYRYPHYTSTGTFRRSPGYLIPVGSTDLPMHEPLRYVLNLRIPENAQPGEYHGRILISHAGFDRALVLPYTVKVLPFRLSRDPGKYITAYAYGIRQLKKGREHRNDPAWLEKASVNDFRRMKEYGFTCPPTLHINYTPRNGGRFYIPDFELLQNEWRKAGLASPRLIALGAFTSQLYRKYMGKSPVKGKIEMPPETFFQEIERLAKAFHAEYEKAGLPELYVLAVDEPFPNMLDYVKRVYRALKNAGLKTFITSCPFRKDVEEYVDVWLDQGFDPLETMRNSSKTEFWSYPNHNVFEIRDIPTMTRGGRMTYGFGFWRSGYTTLIPWMWSWNEGKVVPGIAYGGQILTDSGEEWIEWEWESIREGVIDGAYLYTLQEAIVRREDSSDPRLRALLKEARALLQDLWKKIPPEPKYLADNHWKDGEFDARRLELASMILRLKRYEETGRKTAPSILVDISETYVPRDTGAFFAREEKAGNLFRMPLPEKVWKTNGEKEGSVSVTPEGIVDFRINVDHKLIGNSAGYYRGTPSLCAFFPEKADLTKYAFLSYRMRVSSNRHVVQGTRWPYQLLFFSVDDAKRRTIGSINPASTMEPGIWQQNLYPLNTSLGQKEMSRITQFWFYFREANYEHGDRLRIELADVCLIGAKRPLVQSFRAGSIPASSAEVNWNAELFGEINSPVTAKLTLAAPDGKILASEACRIDRNVMGGTLSCPSPLPVGNYRLRLELYENGRAYQKTECAFRAVSLQP